MFKKTPIALAVVALSTTLAFAHAEETTDLNVDFSNLPSPPAIDGNNGTRIYNGPMVMDQNNVSEVFFKNFNSKFFSCFCCNIILIMSEISYHFIHY